MASVKNIDFILECLLDIENAKSDIKMLPLWSTGWRFTCGKFVKKNRLEDVIVEVDPSDATFEILEFEL